MAKKKIGTSEVTNGEARDWFTISDQLDRGVYQLIAEYTGTDSYKPSHDIKKLIIGWATEIQNLQSYYQIDESTRTLTVKGKLIGYDNSNIEQPLANRTMSIKIGTIANENKSVYEQQLDGMALLLEQSSKNTVKTDDKGNFTFNVIVPVSYTDWHYKLIVAFEGDDDYVSAISTTDLYIGHATTHTVLQVDPSYHIAPDGALTLRSFVVLAEDVIDGTVPNGTPHIKYGTVRFYTSKDGKVWTRITGDDDISYYYYDQLADDGKADIRVKFNFDTSEVTTRYFKATYSGSDDGLGYNPSNSKVAQIKIDVYGDKGFDVVFDIEDLNKTSKTIFLSTSEETQNKIVTIKYGSELIPVPEGKVRYILYDE